MKLHEKNVLLLLVIAFQLFHLVCQIIFWIWYYFPELKLSAKQFQIGKKCDCKFSRQISTDNMCLSFAGKANQD